MAGHIPGPSAQSTPAKRLTRRRWSDPRLLVGVLLVAVAVVGGAMVVEAGDDTTSVWAVAVDVHAGQPAQLSNLHRVDVHVGDAIAEHYLSGSQARLAERLQASVWAHDVPAGELLAASAVVRGDHARAAELPLAVEVGSLPADLRAGERVDVWVGPGRDATTDAAARVLGHVRVQAVRAPSAALGQGATRVVLITLEERAVDDLGDVLARVDRGAVTLVRVHAAEAS